MEVHVKIYLKKNQYVVRFKSSHLKGEIVCRNIVELDGVMNKITYAFPDMTFHIRFSQGALGKYIRDKGSAEVLYKMGYKFIGYINYNIRLFYNSKFNELIIIEDDGILTRCDLKNL